MAPNGSHSGGSSPVAGTSPVNPRAPDPNAVLEPLACFQQVEPQARALPKTMLLAINLDAVKVVETVVGSLGEIYSLLPEVRRQCPWFDEQHVLQLHTFAMALRHAHACYKYALEPNDNLPEIAEEAETYRASMRADANTMVVRGWLDPKLLENVKGLRGYANCASELLILVNIYRDFWSRIEGRTSVTLSELKRAEELVSIMDRLRGVRAQAPAAVADSSDMRTRMFTLLMRSYDQVRRVVTFVRWDEKDADEIAPNLYAVCRGSGDKTRSADQDEPEPAAGASEPTNPPNPQPAAAPSAAPTIAAAPAAPTVANDAGGFKRGGPDGTPGADPFMD